MGIKELVLRKGWAGKTISRDETAERLNPLLRSLIELMHTYSSALETCDAGQEARTVDEFLSVLRTDIGKMSETIHSCGLPAYSGTDIEPGSFPVGPDGWQEVLNRESIFMASLKGEKSVEHHMRTRAIIGAVMANSIARQDVLQKLS